MAIRSFKNEWRPKFIEIVGTDDELTDIAGLGTAIRVFDQSPFSKEFRKCLPERKGSRTLGSYRLALMQIAALVHGQDCLDDLEEFDEDPYLEEMMQGESVAARTMGDFLRDHEPEHLERLQIFLGKMARSIRRHMGEVLPAGYKPAVEPHYMIDSTSHVQHGDRIEGVEWNYKGEWCLDSQRIVDEKALCYGFELRAGATRSGDGACEQVRMAVGDRKQNKRSILSGDSAYCFQEMMRTCLDLEMKFTFTANEAYTGWQEHVREISNWRSWEYSVEDLEKKSRRFKRLGRFVEVGSFNWFPGWAEGKLCFPVVVKRERLDGAQADLFGPAPTSEQLYKYYGVVTNLNPFEYSPQRVIEIHNKRGNAENFIREEKYGFDLKHFPCLAMNANFAYGLYAQIAHNIVRWIATIEKPDKPHFSKKIRRKFVFRAGQVVRHARKIVLKVRHKFKEEVDRLTRAWNPLPQTSIPVPGP